MIVPSWRLIFCVAVVTLPSALLAAAAPGAAPICILFVGFLVAAAVTDALGTRRSLAGIDISLPAIVRVAKDRETRLEVRIRNEASRQRSLRISLEMPPELKTATEEVSTVLPVGSEWSRLSWIFTPPSRGKYTVTSAHVEGVSRLGLFAVRKQLAVNSEIRVYPDLTRERKKLASLFLNRGAFGLHTERQIGQGRDFEKLREYVSGDSFDEIHWKATARRGRAITKVFQIERTQEVYVVVDASRLSARDTDGAPTLERLITAALILGLAAEQQHDLFGLITFSDKVETFVRAGNGTAHYGICRDALYTLQPRTVTPDFDELCTFIRLRLRRRALIVFLTALDDPTIAESFVRSVDLIRRQHLLMVNVIQQPATAPLFSDPKVASVDDLYEHLGGHLRWQKLRQLEKTFQRRGVRFSQLKNERLTADLVSQYLSVKQRQLI
jgi:uncharacterized protein (DUF58 family)